MFDQNNGFLVTFLEIMSALFVFAIGLTVIVVVVLYVIDITQTKHAIRRNFPVIGRFRYFFEHLGEFFRQYFFAMDREELPFNRAERTWAYRAAKNLNNTVAFGSTRDLRRVGTILFVNSPFPVRDEEAVAPSELTIGPYAKQPYTTSSLFNVSAMSYGAISRPAVVALSHGAAKAGAWLNTGEGGLAPYHLSGGADIVFQIGTAKYGARTADGRLDDNKLCEVVAHHEVKMIELKLSQGAKPGKGGILPGAKVTEEVAAIRGIRVGKDSISPNRHAEINTIDDLLEFINRLRGVAGKPVGFKAVLGGYGWLDELCERIINRGIEQAPDFITVDGGDGGTGAAPMPLMDNVGLPLRESLALLVDALQKYDLKDRIKVIASGKLITPVEVAWAFAMGADFVASARGNMFALGCIQALQCNKNTCPTGITTHDADLQRGLVPKEKAQRVAHYIKNMVHEVEVIAHSCGAREPRELRRHHARIVTPSGQSVPLNELFPYQQPLNAAA